MIQFVCDNCSAIKQPEEVWIVGQAAEAVGAVSARREITIQSVWDRANTLHPLAVHFCSVQCKDEYTSRLFGTATPTREVIVETSVPAEVVVERVVPKRETVVTKTRTVRRHKRAA
jgi:hypothetical protein